ncbi:NAD-dependent epimerase/dehydratase family protein [Schumannella sp. 10F1B-5-1]|uniref:NAD-dependent epimerase/dehydratase family protein n=1 Tax=Schumannella sp. 10F1B-5-1 TaxID=2590780 RepID=UPI0011318D3E|nr:NAD-dependent epimerase/dehydratase family protein [Schumannella sp. 10F1B-5-1]TPW76901.1 NAD-dependent epimerase/dehydratase family protein [Schumannella sp. 10F1B-5-1]
MRVLLTRGTGLIGTATLAALLDSGHEVVAVVRSSESAAKVSAAGATAVIGDLTDRDWLGAQLRHVDGAIHLATDNAGPALDDAVVDAVITAFGPTDKPYVHTGGIWVWGSAADISEDDAQNPPAITAWRAGPEGRILGSDVKATLIAPGIVYGPGGHGIPSLLADGPRDASGALELIGSGEQHWTTVAVGDLAELYVIALERSDGHTTYIGANGQNPTVRELGEAIVGSSGSVTSGTVESAHERLGEAFADALLLDQQARGTKARSELGWEPNARSLVAELTAARG